MTRIAAWLGRGAVVAAVGGLLAIGCERGYAQTGGTPPAIAPGKPAGDVGGAPNVPKTMPHDVAFGRFIALIRAHLLTGDELVSKRQWDAAHPHFGFPTEEIYGIIREDLRGYKTPPFDGALKALARTVAAHNARQYPHAYKKVDDALAAADAGLRARQPDWPRFAMDVTIATLKSAPDEYDDAVAKGRIVHPIGYQTARGIVLQADRMFENVPGALRGNDAAALSDIRAGFAQLKQAFANVTAPKQAVLDYAEVMAIVSRIELAAGKLR